MKTYVSVYKNTNEARLIIPKNGHGLMLLMEYISVRYNHKPIFKQIVSTSKSIVFRFSVTNSAVQKICEYINANE